MVVVETVSKPSRFANLWQGAEALAPAARVDIWTSKSIWVCEFLTLLTWKCATAWTFSTSRLPHVVRAWCALCTLTSHVLSAATSSLVWPNGSAPAALASLLLTLRSHKPLEKHSESRLSYLFTHLHLLSSDFLFFDLLSSSLLFSDSSHLCFSSVHIVWRLTSKFPSIICHNKLFVLSISSFSQNVVTAVTQRQGNPSLSSWP